MWWYHFETNKDGGLVMSELHARGYLRRHRVQFLGTMILADIGPTEMERICEPVAPLVRYDAE